MRIALGLEYFGAPFTGWQSQADGRGVQDALERALSAVADARIGTVAAGRTDAGVHATLQVVHFDTDAARPDTAWVRGINAHLPADVAVLWAQPVSAEFHARFAATARALHVSARRPARCARRCSRAASAGTIGRSTSTRCASGGGARRHARFLRVPRRRVPGEVAGARRFAVSVATDGECRPLRFFGQCLSAPHDPQHRRRARLCRRGQGAPSPGSRSSSPRAIARAPRRPSPPTASTSTGADYDPKWELPPTRRPCVSRSRDDAHANARQDLRHHTRGRRSCGGACRRRRDRPRLLGGDAARGGARARARDRRRAAAVRVDRRSVRRSGGRRRARDAGRGAARPSAIPRQRAAGVLSRVRPAATSRRSPSRPGRRRPVC